MEQFLQMYNLPLFGREFLVVIEFKAEQEYVYFFKQIAEKLKPLISISTTTRSRHLSEFEQIEANDDDRNFQHNSNLNWIIDERGQGMASKFRSDDEYFKLSFNTAISFAKINRKYFGLLKSIIHGDWAFDSFELELRENGEYMTLGKIIHSSHFGVLSKEGSWSLNRDSVMFSMENGSFLRMNILHASDNEIVLVSLLDDKLCLKLRK